MNQEEIDKIASRKSGSELDERFAPKALALKARNDQNINGSILRRFPRFIFANKGLR
jgi:hypothetical protein